MQAPKTHDEMKRLINRLRGYTFATKFSLFQVVTLVVVSQMVIHGDYWPALFLFVVTPIINEYVKSNQERKS